MKKLYLLLILLIVGCSTQKKANNIENIASDNFKEEKNITVNEKKLHKAWNGTYWGMSPEEVNKIYPVNKREFDLYCPEGFILKECTTYLYNNFKIGSTVYDIAFNFIKDQLVNVKLECHNGNQGNRI